MKQSPLASIFLIVLVDVLGLTIILPLLPFYAESMGATPATVGLLVSVYALSQLIAGPILGQISDRVGRRPVLLVSQIGTFVGFIILALSRTLVPVFLARVIDGLTAGNLSVAQAYISDVTAPEKRARSFGMIGVAFGLGFLVGPAISGFLAQYGYSYPIFAAAGLSLTSIVMTYFLLPPVSRAAPASAPAAAGGSRAGRAGFVRYLKDPNVGPLLWQFFAFTFAFGTFVSGFALFAERRFTYGVAPFGPQEVGYVFAYSGLIGLIIQAGLIGVLVKAFGEARLVRAGFVSMLAGFVVMAWAVGLTELLVSITVLSFGSSIVRPSLTSLVTQRVGRNQQGMSMGLMQSLMSTAQIIAPVLAGVLIQRGYLSLWAWVGAAVCGLGMLLIHRQRRREAAYAID